MHAANEVIMPVLGMNQDTGKIVRWLAAEGQPVKQGEPLFEVETDKAVAEIEAPASGTLSAISAHAGDDVPVGKVIAVIAAAGISVPAREIPPVIHPATPIPPTPAQPVTASPVAARMAAEHKLDLAQIRPSGGRIEKADVLAYLATREHAQAETAPRPAASPMARRLAAERGLDLAAVHGSGPGGAVLSADLPAVAPVREGQTVTPVPYEVPQSAIWKIMAERTATAWREAPHFYLMREVDAGQLLQWRKAVQVEGGVKITVTDLLVKLSAVALRRHPEVNVCYQDGRLIRLAEVKIGFAAAVDAGLVVPVIARADTRPVAEIAALRAGLVERARENRLRPEEISGATFTISNLGMYGVDSFLAVLNPPQAAILAVGRIAERVAPVNGQVAIRPRMTVSLSCDHRAVDGARGAQFLDTLARLIEEPLSLLA